MVAVPTPRRDQIQRWVGGDEALAPLIESLFRVAGDEVPTQIDTNTANITANTAAIGANAAEIVFNAAAIGDNATDIADNAAAILLRLVASNNLSDLDDAAAARTNLALSSLAILEPTGTADATTYLRGDGAWSPIVTGVYTVATLPPVIEGGIIYVTDEVGGATHASGDGTNWRRMSDRAIVP